MMTNTDKIEKLLDELAQEVKNAQGAIVAVAIVPFSDNKSAITGRSYGNAGRIATAIREAEKDNEEFQKIRFCYQIIDAENNFNNPAKD